MDSVYLQKLLTAGIFYMPFLAFIGFAVFVFIIGLSALITGTLFFFCFAVYGIYASLRDFGLIEMCLQRAKSLFQRMDIDILQNINQSFVLHSSENIPKGQCIFLCHPHGIMGLSWFYHLCHPFQGWGHSEKRPYLALHSILFKFPFLRELMRSYGCIESSEEVLRSHIEKGDSVAIITGGAEEMMYSDEGELKLILKKRKGYARLAKDFGIPIVPLISRNENNIVPQHSSFLWKGLNDFLFRFARLCFPLPSLKAIRTWMQILHAPLPEPIETFVLVPIETKNKNIESIRQETVDRIERFLVEKKVPYQFIG